MAASGGLRGVRDDLWELGRHIVDIACFLSPILASAHADSPPPSPTSDPQRRRHSSHQQTSLRRRRRRPRSFRTPSPHPSARVLAGILSDLAEIGGGLRSGISRLSAAFRDLPDSTDDDAESRGKAEMPPVAAAASASDDNDADRAGNLGFVAATEDLTTVGVSDEVLEFVGDLVKCPESWLEFPVPAGDSEFHMSHVQRVHIATMQQVSTDLTTLRSSLCPTYMSEVSFWRIYFALLHPRLNEHDSELLSTQQILDSFRVKLKGTQNMMNTRSPSLPSVIGDNEIRSQPEESRAWENIMTARTRSQQSIDQFSEVPSIVDAYSDDANTVRVELMTARTRSQQSIDQFSEVPSIVDAYSDCANTVRVEHGSTTGIGDGNVVMEKYMDALLIDLGETNSSGKNHHLAGNRNVGTRSMSEEDMFYAVESIAHSGSWHPVEDSDFEVVEQP